MPVPLPPGMKPPTPKQEAPKQETSQQTNPAPATPLPTTQAPARPPAQPPAQAGNPLAPPTPQQEKAAAEAETRLTAVSQANAVTGLTSDSGGGKTSQACEAIEFAWEEYGRISRVYHFDSGGFGNKLIKLARLGIAQIWTPRNHVEPFETAELASLGYWPEKVLNLDTGYAEPDVRLVPPQVTRWAVYCPNGHLVQQVRSQRLLDTFQIACPECRTITTLQNWGKVDKEVVRSPGFRHVGLYVYDSVTAMSDWVMQDMAEKTARDELGGTDRNALRGSPSKIVSGSMVFGSNSMAHYGFAQNRVQSWLANMRRIPYQVVPPIATFLENRGSDEANITVFGPKIAGTARTADVPAWLGNALHLAKTPGPGGRLKYRIWTETHSSPSEGNIPHLAKHRGEPGDIPPYLEDADGAPPFSTCSLKFFFRRMDEALKRSLARGVETYANAPALTPLLDDDVEEIVSTTSASAPSQVVRSGGPPVAGAAPAPMTAVPPSGVPLPPGMRPAVPPPAQQVVHHKDGDPRNNHTKNLEVREPLHLVQKEDVQQSASSPAAAPAIPPKTAAVGRSRRPALPTAGEKAQ